MKSENIKKAIRTIPDFPKKGIMFRDITTLLQNKIAFHEACDEFYNHYKNEKIDAILGIESRGFIFGSVLAYKLGVGFIPARKPGKLPYKTITESYDLEYGTNTIEIHEDAIKKGEKILIVDDLLATGGTANAACKLVEKLGGKIIECAFIVDLPDLGGKKRLEAAGYKTFRLVEFEGE
jgi:adenine phosphoribosyltransferase